MGKKVAPTASATRTATATRTPTNTPSPTNTPTNSPTATAPIPAGEVWKFYYFAGAKRAAVRTKTTGSNTLNYLLGDHLGSTSVTATTEGEKVGEMRYNAWGGTRMTQGDTPTDYQYTGQRNENGIGLYYYNARWYDASLGHFAQADTVVPGGVQGYDRYAYTNNNPVNGTDPSGYSKNDKCNTLGCQTKINEYLSEY
jgi:RHS repeat-associated protein